MSTTLSIQGKAIFQLNNLTKKIVGIFFILFCLAMHSSAGTMKLNASNSPHNSEFKFINLFTNYTMNIQSQVFYINGCFYKVKGVLSFSWDGVPGHSPTNVSVTSIQLVQDCGLSNHTYIARINEFNYSQNASFEVSTLNFESLEDADLDKALESEDLLHSFQEEIEHSVNSLTN